MKKVYGPYQRKDGRRHVIHYDFENGTRKTQSYPRYLMEIALGRKLESWEHVDHINNDPTDDRVENYQVLTQKENNQKATIFHGKSAKLVTLICLCCKVEFKRESRKEKDRIARGNDGPFCSKSCVGIIYH